MRKYIKFKNYLMIIIGSILLLIGVIGLFIPLLPTTPFLILTAFFYANSSSKVTDSFTNSRLYKNQVEIFLHKGITIKTKILILVPVILLLSILFFTLDNIIFKFIIVILGLLKIFAFCFIKTNKLERIEIDNEQ